MDSRVQSALTKIQRNPGASTEEMRRVETELGVRLPRDYVELMTWSNGGEGPVGEKSYLSLWPVENIPSLNRAHMVGEYWPGLLLFGSDGGGEAYGFDFRSSPPMIVRVPFESADPSDIRFGGQSIVEFLEYLIRK